MDKLCFIINSSSRKYQIIKNEIFRDFSDMTHEVFMTKCIGHGSILAEKAIKSGFRHIIAIGGDGTLNEVLNGILTASEELDVLEKDRIRLGVIPAGTGNDFIKTIKSPITLSALKDSIRKDRTNWVDIGILKYQNTDGMTDQRYFINVVDVGLGGLVAKKLSHSTRRFGPFLTYQKAIVSSLLTYRKQSIEVVADSFHFEGKSLLCIIANAKYFGSGIGIAPDADPTSGHLSVVVMGNISILDYVKKIGDARKCLPIIHPEILYKSVKTMEVTHLNERLPIDMDGEFIGYSPIKAGVVAKAVRFYI